MKYIVILSSFLALISCSDLKKNEQIQAITKMEATLDSIQTVLKANEVDTIAGLSTAANVIETRIKNNYKTDTIDMELGRKMDAYKIMRRSFRPLGDAYYRVQEGTSEEKLTLANLKKDIENGDGDRAKYDEYVKFEEEKVNQLRILLDDYIQQKTKTMNTFHELHEELEAFSWSLTTKK